LNVLKVLHGSIPLWPESLHRRGWIGISAGLCLLWAPLARGHQEIEVLVADLDRRIREEPSDAALHLRRGELRRLHREWTLALEDYQRARDLDPRLAVVDLCLGKVLLELGLWTPALVLLDRYIAERPLEAEGLASRALARRRLGDLAGSADDLAQAIDFYPANLLPPPELYLENARALAAQGGGRVDEALRVLDEGLARLGRTVTLALSAVELELERKRYSQALARLDEAARSSPRKEVWLLRRGRILEEAGKAEEAREAYREALGVGRASPAFRRNTPAAHRLEAEARASLERLSMKSRNF
jgi:predicted Zn-dependent protease